MSRPNSNFLKKWLIGLGREIFDLASNHPFHAILILMIALYAISWLLSYLLRKKREERALKVLNASGRANKETKISFKELSITHASVSSADCERELNFYNELFGVEDLVRVEHRNHKHLFKKAEFPERLTLPSKPTGKEIGFNDRGVEARVKYPNILIQTLPGKGKTALLNYLIACSYQAMRRRPFEIVISDVHGSFEHLHDVLGITLRNGHEEKVEILQKIDEALDYQRVVKLGSFESLMEMQAAGQGLEYKSFRFCFDEVSSSFTSAASKEEAKLNQEILMKIILLLRSGRKYNQFVWASDQDLKRTSSVLESTAFACEVHSFSEIANTRDGYPTTAAILKQPGTFYLVDRHGTNTFVRLPFVSKQKLLELIRSAK